MLLSQSIATQIDFFPLTLRCLTALPAYSPDFLLDSSVPSIFLVLRSLVVFPLLCGTWLLVNVFNVDSKLFIV